MTTALALARCFASLTVHAPDVAKRGSNAAFEDKREEVCHISSVGKRNRSLKLQCFCRVIAGTIFWG